MLVTFERPYFSLRISLTFKNYSGSRSVVGKELKPKHLQDKVETYFSMCVGFRSKPQQAENLRFAYWVYHMMGWPNWRQDASRARSISWGDAELGDFISKHVGLSKRGHRMAFSFHSHRRSLWLCGHANVKQRRMWTCHLYTLQGWLVVRQVRRCKRGTTTGSQCLDPLTGTSIQIVPCNLMHARALNSHLQARKSGSN